MASIFVRGAIVSVLVTTSADSVHTGMLTLVVPPAVMTAAARSRTPTAIADPVHSHLPS